MSKKEKINHALLQVALQHHNAGRIGAAEEIYRDLLKENPKSGEVLHLLARLVHQKGQLEECFKLLKRARDASPKDADIHYHLGNCYLERRQLDQAIECYKECLALQPAHKLAPVNLGIANQYDGRLEEAVTIFRQELQSNPANYRVHSHLVYTLHMLEGIDAAALLHEHRQWNRVHGEPLKRSWPTYANPRDPQKRIRIGYVSPDLRNHVVGRFMAPILSHHDHTHFEIYCYARFDKPDDMSDRLKKTADVWRYVGAMPPDPLSRLIQQDQIDILVDLAMHMDGEQMLLFAKKPAPVQATYLAYVSTTGLEAIDYRISDIHIDPPGKHDEDYSERTLRLPESYWCYEGVPEAPPPADLPAASNNFITFGSLSNFSKISNSCLRAWGRILQELPDSRLVIHAYPGSRREGAARILREMNIATRRFEFVGHLVLPEYFKQYTQFDIALDSFPHAGGTTTCDALWMGVPMVTLAGKTAVGRGGVSLLHNVQLPDLVAASEDDYVRIATALATDLPRLKKLRTSLRPTMQASPLMNAPAFTRNLESLYRTMWQSWCAAHP